MGLYPVAECCNARQDTVYSRI